MKESVRKPFETLLDDESKYEPEWARHGIRGAGKRVASLVKMLETIGMDIVNDRMRSVNECDVKTVGTQNSRYAVRSFPKTRELGRAFDIGLRLRGRVKHNQVPKRERRRFPELINNASIAKASASVFGFDEATSIIKLLSKSMAVGFRIHILRWCSRRSRQSGIATMDQVKWCLLDFRMERSIIGELEFGQMGVPGVLISIDVNE